MIKPISRLESKYSLDVMTYHRVRNFLAPYFHKDRFSKHQQNGCYLVRSLYYDTDDYQAYFEKQTGIVTRNKLRLRTYQSCRRDTNFIKVEQKRRFGNRTNKLVTQVPVTQYDRFIQGGDWGEGNNPLLDDFVRQIFLTPLSPKLIVEYDREAYMSRDKSDLRISFDHKIRFAQAKSLFEESLNFKTDHHRHVVMEIKTTNGDSALASRLTREFDLKAIPNSKYAIGIEHTQKALWY